MTGVRTDLVDAYLFRRPPDGPPEFLQLRRAREPYPGTWHPVMGHVEALERAPDAALREAREETGLPDDALLAMWALERVHPFYLAPRDEVCLSPRFALEVSAAWTPILNDEHDAHRWVPEPEIDSAFVWRGQGESVREIVELLTRPERAALLRLR